MTRNQIEYSKLLETQKQNAEVARANRENEQIARDQLQLSRNNLRFSYYKLSSEQVFNYKKLQTESDFNYARLKTETQLETARQAEQKRVNSANIAFNLRQLAETTRSNKARETETKRANLAREFETARANTAAEYENYRSHVASEQIARTSNENAYDLGLRNIQARYDELAEQKRSNLAREKQINYQNETARIQTGISAYDATTRRLTLEQDTANFISRQKQQNTQFSKSLDETITHNRNQEAETKRANKRSESLRKLEEKNKNVRFLISEVTSLNPFKRK